MKTAELAKLIEESPNLDTVVAALNKGVRFHVQIRDSCTRGDWVTWQSYAETYDEAKKGINPKADKEYRIIEVHSVSETLKPKVVI